MTPSKKCLHCGTVFHRTPENVYSWGKKIYCSDKCGYDALNAKRRREGRKEKIKKGKKSTSKRPMCYSDADWALWNLQDPVTDLCQRDRYNAASPCECCEVKYMVKMRTAGKCDRYAKLQKL